VLVARASAVLAVLVLAGACGGASETPVRPAAPEEPPVPPLPADVALDPRFEKVTLHREFYCEGAAFGDFDRDGHTDVAAGPDWYRGPGYGERSPIWPRPEVAFDVKGYSDCFFQFTHDFDADGWLDLLVVGFPGAPAAWYENPRQKGVSWRKHALISAVDGESPSFQDISGDGVPELVMMFGGALGWAAPDPADPQAAWTFHAATEARGYGPFTHGLGTGDLDGDGRRDLLEATGYFLQPAAPSGAAPWLRGEQAFGLGGAQIWVTDLDADGDADVVSSLAAHGYGLAWYERTDGALAFVEHVIVPNQEPLSDASVVLHEPHALALADVDGDGLEDIVTGERFWGHVPSGEPDFAAPGRLYWFRRALGPGGPVFTPTLIDADSGVGTQVTVGDADEDGDIDIAVSNKKGAFVFRQRG
jgi:hypothetical protein